MSAIHDGPPVDRLDRIRRDIDLHRCLREQELDAGHFMASEWHEGQVDALVAEEAAYTTTAGAAYRAAAG